MPDELEVVAEVVPIEPPTFEAIARERVAELERHVATLEKLVTFRMMTCARNRVGLLGDDVYRAVTDAVAMMQVRAADLRRVLGIAEVEPSDEGAV
jgi:hypothetical protein